MKSILRIVRVLVGIALAVLTPFAQVMLLVTLKISSVWDVLMVMALLLLPWIVLFALFPSLDGTSDSSVTPMVTTTSGAAAGSLCGGSC